MATQTAQLRFLRMAPRKVRLVADTLKGLSVNEAEAQLLLQPRRVARPLLKLLRSAVANAKNNQKLNPDTLYVSSIRVDQGPMLKRFLPRARGSASPIQKKMSHVFLALEERKTAKAARFTITVPKKIKDRGVKRTVKREKISEEMTSPRPAAEEKGMLKRFFRRKSV